MSTHRTTLEEKCKKCNTNKVRIHVKDCFIDDFDDECPKCENGEALDNLNATSRRIAKSERD